MIAPGAVAVDPTFWQDKSVLVTGHTGFKGSWLSLWLSLLGARVHGFALSPLTQPNLFDLLQPAKIYHHSTFGDVRNINALQHAVADARPDIVFHLAAQALVRQSYTDPLTTFDTNVMGTANVLRATCEESSVRAVVVVTSDKCYENREWLWGYREQDTLGGHDPYSASKACAELVVRSWQQSFCNPAVGTSCPAVASVRAGNVIGGGDWSVDRLVPDILACADAGRPVTLRNPRSVRPWQHVLEPLWGYLLLAQRLFVEDFQWAESWNFGPGEDGNTTVSHLADRLLRALATENQSPLSMVERKMPDGDELHETTLLRLDCSKARQRLGWMPVWTIDQTVSEIARWHQDFRRGEDMYSSSASSIRRYEAMHKKQRSSF